MRAGTMKQRIDRLGILSAFILLLAGCVPASTITPVDSLSQVGNDQVIVVGKVELDPALSREEQTLGENYEEFRNLALVITDNELRPTPTLGLGDLAKRINAPLGETFFVGHPAEPFYILKSWVVMNAEIKMVAPDAAPVDGNAPLFGTFAINVQPGDQAVYIGTIRYHRDTFFGTEKVEVVDDYTRANAEFTRKFGGHISLRKALAKPVGGS